MDCELDIGTGEVVHEVTDFQLVSPIPLRLTRRYVSSVEQSGVLGWGWADNFAGSLILDESFLSKLDPISGDLVFPRDQCDGKLGPMILAQSETQLVLRYPDLTEETYFVDPENWRRWLLVVVQDANGNRLIYHYSQNLLVRIESKMLDVSFVHGYAGLLSRLDVTRGRGGRALMSVAYEHDSNRDLVGWSGTSTESVFCSYDNHLLVRVAAGSGTANYVYDSGRRCIGSWREGGSVTRLLKYDGVRHRTLVADSYGRGTLFGTTETGAVTSHVDALGHLTLRLLDGQGGIFAGIFARIGSVALGDAYDPAIKALRTPDAMGNMWLRQLDEKSRLTRIVSPSGATKGIPSSRRSGPNHRSSRMERWCHPLPLRQPG